MEKFFCLLVLILLFASGCAASNGNDITTLPDADIPLYSRSTSQITLHDDYNPYMTEFTKQGIFYFVQEEELAEGSEEYVSGYNFFFQPYDDSMAAVPLCELKDGYVRDFAGVQKDGAEYLAVLWIGEEAHISEYDENGKLCRDTVIDNLFNNIEKFPTLLALPGGEYVIGMEKEVYLLNPDGAVTKTIKTEGYVRRLLAVDEGPVYVLYEKDEGRNTAVYMSETDFSKGRLAKTRKVPGDTEKVSLFEENRFVSFSNDYAYLFEMDESKDEILVDLKKQSILSSQIQLIFGSRDEIKVASMDTSAPAQGVYLFFLTEAEEMTAGASEKEQYSPDGRRIVWVAVPEGYGWQIEFHANKYNQTSDAVYVEIERFDGPLEDYLGRGERPDVVMLNDQTEIAPLAERGMLEDLLPLFDGQDRYSVSEILPKARELLGFGDGMYAMTGRFEMLLRTSIETEFDDLGKCTAADYLKWYDAFLDENQITGMGSLYDVLYADIRSFYDDSTGEVFFTSNEFKELMMTFKEVSSRHKGEIDKYLGRDKGYTVRGIASGPRWYLSLGNAWEITDPDSRLVGMPTPDGDSIVLTSLAYPMGIMSTSDYKEGAFDFIMYYCRLNEYLGQGSSSDAYGASYLTLAPFSTYEDIMKEEIYETEKPFAALRGAGDIPEFYYFTDEHKEQLKDLIEGAVADTKVQKDIYGMFLEEMDGFLQGDKDLDAACEILQNRVSLYMDERH